jgi:hypothetical protein
MKVGFIETRWYTHPGKQGSSGHFETTKANVQIANRFKLLVYIFHLCAKASTAFAVEDAIALDATGVVSNGLGESGNGQEGCQSGKCSFKTKHDKNKGLKKCRKEERKPPS